MNDEQFRKIAHLEGLEFVQALLRLEEQRFESSQFPKGSTFEDINADFGIFPTMAAYSVYFADDIKKPDNKIVFDTARVMLSRYIAHGKEKAKLKFETLKGRVQDIVMRHCASQ